MQRLWTWPIRLAAVGYGCLATMMLINEGGGPATAVAAPLAATPIALGWRRPVPSLAVSLACLAVVWAAAPRAIVLGFLSMAYVLFPLGYRCRPRTAWTGLAVALACVWALGGRGGAALFTVVFAAVWAVAYGARLHRGHTERLMAERAKRGVAEERLRIARELHDVVAHGMSVITVQAGFGALVIDERPGEARDALEAIQATGRGTLTEMRRLLGVLRTDDEPGLEPAPGLADLDALIDRTARAGVQVDLRTRGTARPLPAGAELSVYRIVQEAVTNVVKHAGASTARVVLDYRDDALVVEVTDAGRGCPASPRPGHGLLGMNERARLFGGTLRAAPIPGGGFQVVARLPIAEPAA
ncbi:sensor histidine kinase [Actinomadura macra]|uniref:sensor histidine kinase n=1 Tax=Actinomadura macra TaxID=46164 RepID=UPI0008375957|nr:sensor histidine kinase [Actinomadura macra]